MSISKVGICNNALIKLGADTITSLTEDTKNARICNIMYDKVRTMLLRSHIWNFAIGRQTLSQLTTAPAFEYAYQYQLPTDSLRVVKVYKDNGMPYKIEGTKLLTDLSSVSLVYIKDEEDPVQFDVSFQEVLSTKLAAEIAYAITGSASRAAQLNDEYKRLVKEAKLWDGQEDIPDDWTNGSWLDSRD